MNKIVFTFRRLTILLSLVPWMLSAQSKLIIVLRVDDVLSRNTAILPRSITPFQEAVEQRGGIVTWLVIPHRLIEAANNDGLLIRELKSTRARGHEVAQHGYNHICFICGSSGHEMWCTTRPLLYSEQIQLIQNGRQLIQDSVGITPTLFVSPGHNEDTATYRAVCNTGFPWISTTKSTRQNIFGTLYNLPSDAEYTWQMTDANYRTQLELALNQIRSVGEPQGCYTLLFHDYFIRSGYVNGIVIRWAGELLDSLNRRYGNRIQYMTLSGAAQYFKTLTTVASIAEPSTYFLTTQNYPNPFNPTTVIRYELPVASSAKLLVYDLLGREAAVLVNEVKSAGVHTVAWNARSFSSGVYYYKLEVRSLNSPIQHSAAVRKIILMK